LKRFSLLIHLCVHQTPDVMADVIFAFIIWIIASVYILYCILRKKIQMLPPVCWHGTTLFPQQLISNPEIFCACIFSWYFFSIIPRFSRGLLETVPQSRCRFPLTVHYYFTQDKTGRVKTPTHLMPPWSVRGEQVEKGKIGIQISRSSPYRPSRRHRAAQSGDQNLQSVKSAHHIFLSFGGGRTHWP
jgi:hypothetical protein